MSYQAVILTVSGSCAAGTRTDTSGPAIRAMLENAGFAVQAMQTVPDEEEQISAAIVHACDILQADLVVTTGGTGLSPRDVTPEATLAVLCRNAHMAESEVKEGKIELKAEIDGLFRVDVERLNAVNLLDEIMIATRHNNFPVHAGDKLCGTRVIPLIIQDEKLRRAEALAGDTPILELLPYKLKTAGVITTGSEVASGRIQDTFTPILAKKLQAYGITMTEHLTVSDGLEQVAAAIDEMRKNRSTRSSAPAA